MTKPAYFFPLLLALTTTASFANEETINTSSELKNWCETESKRYFLSKRQRPYNWTASWWDSNNILYAKGSWRVEGKDASILCRIEKGGLKKFASIDISHKDKNFSAINQGDNRSINTPAELRNWCKEESKKHLLTRKKLPQNWRAYWWDETNMLHAKGTWQVGKDEISVTCHVGRGGATRHATMEVSWD